MTAMVLLSDWMKSQVEFWAPSRMSGYDVSSFGRLRSYWDKEPIKGPKRSKGFRSVHCEKPHLLSPSCDSSGYPYINARYKGYGCPKIHRLVADAFIPNPDQLPEVNHLTGVKHDARLGNLERASKQRNMQHAYASGLKDRMTVVTTADVLEIRRRADNGEPIARIARDFAPARYATIRGIARRKSWKFV